MAEWFKFKWGMSLVRTNKGIRRFKPGTIFQGGIINSNGDYVDIEFDDDRSIAQNVLEIAIEPIDINKQVVR